jgi:hypothetical protein
MESPGDEFPRMNMYYLKKMSSAGGLGIESASQIMLLNGLG